MAPLRLLWVMVSLMASNIRPVIQMQLMETLYLALGLSSTTISCLQLLNCAEVSLLKGCPHDTWAYPYCQDIQYFQETQNKICIYSVLSPGSQVGIMNSIRSMLYEANLTPWFSCLSSVITTLVNLGNYGPVPSISESFNTFNG